MYRCEKGFSLIELMAVTVIMGLVATVSIPLGEMIYQKAREQQVVEAVSEVRQALDWYYEDHGHFPQVTTGDTAEDALTLLVDEGYLNNMPQNPYTNRYDDWEVRDSTGSNWVEVKGGTDQNTDDSLATVSGSVRFHRITDVMDIRFPNRYDIDDPSGRSLSTY